MVRRLRRILGNTGSCFSLSRSRSSGGWVHRRLGSWTRSLRRRQRISRWFSRRHIRRYHNSNSSFLGARNHWRTRWWICRRIIWRLSWFSSRRSSDCISHICRHNCSCRRPDRWSNNPIKPNFYFYNIAYKQEWVASF